MPRKPYSKPILTQLETQARLTLTLLPLVSALPFFSDEAITRTFGQSMLVLNWIPPHPWVAPLPVPLPEVHESCEPRTKEQQRAYWREAQRKYRERIKTQKGKPE